MTRAPRWLSLVAVALATAGGSACESDDAKAEGPPKASPPAPVVTATLKAQQLVVERRYLGEVRALADAALTVGEPGPVARVLVREGDRVEEGQVLLEIDDRLARAQLGEAAATRKSLAVEKAFAEHRVKVFERLVEEDAGSPGEVDEQRTQARALQARQAAAGASVQAQAERVQRHRIVAPFAGVVSRRHVDPGDWLDPGESALEVVSEGRVEVQVRVPPALVEEEGSIVDVKLAVGQRSTRGGVVAMVGALDPETRTALLRVSPEEAEPWLRPNAPATVVFSVKQTGGWVVPRDALVYGVQKVRLVRVVDGQAKPLEVEVLAEHGGEALVRGEGLAAGVAVVTRGNERLRPDQPVAPSAAPSGSAAPKTP